MLWMTILWILVLAVPLIAAYAAVVERVFNNRGSRPCRPGPVVILSVKEDEFMTRYVYTFALPAPGAGDVVARELHLKVDGVEELFNIEPSLLEYKLSFNEDASVEIYLIDIDDADNRSLPSQLLNFVVIDIVPPPAPSMPEIIGVEEEFVEDAVEEPVLEEDTTVDEPMPEDVVEDSTEDAVVEEPTEDAVEEPALEDSIEEEAIEEPVVDEPVIDEPAAEESADDPILDESILDEPMEEELPAIEETVEETEELSDVDGDISDELK